MSFSLLAFGLDLWIMTSNVIGFSATAQEIESDSSVFAPWDVSLMTGRLLPQNITGFHETLGLAGLRVGTSIETFRPELLLVGGNELGQAYQGAWLSLKNRVNPVALDGFLAFWYFGLQYTRYRLPSRDSIQYPFFQASGPHFGFGAELPISPHFSLRSDFYLGLSPGRMLLMALSVQMKLGANDSGGKRP